jgi:hypothetical protein
VQDLQGLIVYYRPVTSQCLGSQSLFDRTVRKSEHGDAKEDDAARMGARGPKYRCAKWR